MAIDFPLYILIFVIFINIYENANEIIIILAHESSTNLSNSVIGTITISQNARHELVFMG